MRFHLMHVVSGGHGLLGYKEVIDSVQWGLTALGHDVTYAVNQIAPGVRNIVFGVQVVPPDDLPKFPDDTIVYNFEQVRGVSPTRIRPALLGALRRFRLWDYSLSNLPTWTQVELRYPPVHVPVGYAPILERIPRAPIQDIDALIYGMPNELRLSAFHAIARAGLSSVFVCGLYGQARDDLIARAKTVIDVTLFDRMRVFEIVRVSYLLANRKAVVASIDEGTYLEDGVLDAIAPADRMTLQGRVIELCADDARRAELEQRGYDYFSRRDIRPILENAIEAS